MYYLLITYPHSTKEVLMNTGVRAVASTEENKEHLISIGNRLLIERIISSYQLVMTVDNSVTLESFSNE